MALPVLATQGRLAYASRTNSPVPVPTGVAATDLILVYFYAEDAGDLAVTPPTGFAAVTFPTATYSSGPGGNYLQKVYWKRATAADTGTYTFTHTAGITEVVALRITGAVTSGTPFDFVTSALRATTGTTSAAVSGTTTGPDRLLLHGVTNYQRGAQTPPAGWTEQYDLSQDLYINSRTQAAAGATGAVQATVPSWESSFATLVAVASPTATVAQGSASGSWSFAGAGSGKRTPKATGSGVFTFASSAVGARPVISGFGQSTFGTSPFGGVSDGIGSAAGTWAFTGTAVGKRTPKATGIGALAFVGAASGAALGEFSSYLPVTATLAPHLGTATLAAVPVGTAALATDGTSTAVLASDGTSTAVIHTT